MHIFPTQKWKKGVAPPSRHRRLRLEKNIFLSRAFFEGETKGRDKIEKSLLLKVFFSFLSPPLLSLHMLCGLRLPFSAVLMPI